MASTKFLKFAIANDSGVSHMLSTNECPLVKLFGPKDSDKFTPNKTVILKGEILSPGTYLLVNDRESLISIIERAGGFLPGSDI